jgi:ligand-binding SRPBCC domain-containing protein
MTEITHVERLRYFVDEQRFGPYAFWHHQHHFKEVEGGVEMTDLVHYRLPFGPLGTLANALFVRKRLHDIFDYRTRVIPTLLQ